MSSSEELVKGFFQTLAQQNNLRPNEPHIYAGDSNSHVGEKMIEVHLSQRDIPKVSARIGDDKRPPEPPQMPFLDNDRPSSKQRGGVFKA